MKTSNYKRFSADHPGAISISLFPPAGKGYKHYPALAPSKLWWKAPPEIYIPQFEAHLAQLNPWQVWDELHALAGDAEPVLLCFESIPQKHLHLPAAEIPSPNFCHRRLCAEWFERFLGVQVPEFIPTKKAASAPVEGQIDFFQLKEPMPEEEFLEDDLEADVEEAVAESKPDGEVKQPKPDPPAEEPYEYGQSTIFANVTLLPDDGHEKGRQIILSVRSSHDGSEPKMKLVRASDILLPEALSQLLTQLEQEFPQRKSLYEAKKAEAERVAEERKQTRELAQKSQKVSQKQPKAGLKAKSVKVNKNAPTSSKTVNQSTVF